MEHPAVTARSPADVDTYRKLREIHVQGSGVPKPCTTFEEASFPGEASMQIHRPATATLHPAFRGTLLLHSWVTLTSAAFVLQIRRDPSFAPVQSMC